MDEWNSFLKTWYDTRTPMFINTVYNSYDVGATLTCINRRMDREVVIHAHNRILLSYKKECIWLRSIKVGDLEPIIQSEVNQKEKNKYHILTHTYGTQKDGTDKSIYINHM